MKLKPGAPPTKITELLVKGANIPRGLDRAWVRVPLISQAPQWDMFCPCTTNSTQSRGMLEVKRITLLQISVALVCQTHGQLPTKLFWTGFCDRCGVVYWAAS